MKNNRLYPGIILICIGLAFLLNRLGVVHFNWSNLLYLWPLILVIAGVNLLLSHNRAPWATLVRVVVAVSCLGILFFGNFNFSPRWGKWHFNHSRNQGRDDLSFDNDSDNSSHGIKSSSTYSEPFDTRVKIAKLNISGGVTSYVLRDTSADLLSAQAQEYNGRYIFDHTITDSTAEISLHKKNVNVRFGNSDSDQSNKTEIRLNSKPVWDISIKGGADELRFDLSKFKVRNLQLSGGATDYKVKMGIPQAETHVNISAGVSDITIEVPTGAACQVTTSTGLSSNEIEGFNKISSNHYETANFGSAAQKIYVHFSGGISDFTVKRY
ncbi:LiaI-LiaF-like domain-containing protein [Mucilaginibacter sp.]